MGHYDGCRDGYCPACEQSYQYCQCEKAGKRMGSLIKYCDACKVPQLYCKCGGGPDKPGKPKKAGIEGDDMRHYDDRTDNCLVCGEAYSYCRCRENPTVPLMPAKPGKPKKADIEEVKLFKTSDGQTFEVLQDAEKHQEEQIFLEWCENNVCYDGRKWEARMVAKKILESWKVERK